MCVIHKPPENINLSYKMPVIILDAVRDAGNVGTIIRTANALCECEFIFTHDCADLYNPKTLRAAMGANFYQKIKICENINNIKNEVEKLKENGYNIFATFLDKNSKTVEDVKFDARTAVIFGNEGKGISDDIIKLCDEKIIIPVHENSESLNVSIAAGIIFWEMNKRMGREKKYD
jgi:TrmH family RNA methyltransferase